MFCLINCCCFTCIVGFRCCLICSFLHLFCFVYIFFNSLPVCTQPLWLAVWRRRKPPLTAVSRTKLLHIGQSLHPLQSGWHWVFFYNRSGAVAKHSIPFFLHIQLNPTLCKTHHCFHILREGSSRFLVAMILLAQVGPFRCNWKHHSLLCASLTEAVRSVVFVYIFNGVEVSQGKC